MKIYQDLEFRGDPQALNRLPAEIEKRLTNGWSRNHEREAELRKTLFGRMYCFSCVGTASRPAATLALATKSAGTLHVSNIVPSDVSSLTYDEYNSILQEFYDGLALPSADTLGVSAELGKAEERIEDFLSEPAVRALRAFSSAANRSILHPLDRKRWYEFLTVAHREQASLTGPMLQRWLIEEEKWPEDKAIDLVIEYENAQQLLEVYEAQQV